MAAFVLGDLSIHLDVAEYAAVLKPSDIVSRHLDATCLTDDAQHWSTCTVWQLSVRSTCILNILSPSFISLCAASSYWMWTSLPQDSTSDLQEEIVVLFDGTMW